MISVENLSKVYSAKKTVCEALRGVDFVLPESGLVFIIGKSGSGKSTLLNLLGGLDKPTSGDIAVGEKKYSEFTVRDFDNFRNEKLGFVFQDFCLIEGLTVRENIGLVLDLQTKDDCGIITDTLISVGLEGLESRYPKELSAGQKQRVAIARALVKNPRILLADEPTGNIDSKTSEAVLNILKEMSRDKLVAVISHNTDDAKKYADRIIELADGRIITDVTREEGYDNCFEIDLPEIVLPYKKPLDESELLRLNKCVRRAEGQVFFNQKSSGFIPTEQPENIGNAGSCVSKGMTPKNIIKYSVKLFKKRRLGTILTIIILAFLMSVFSMAQLFIRFDGNAQVEDYIKKDGDRGLVLSQGYYDEESLRGNVLKDDRLIEVNQSAVDELKKHYGGEIYKMYSVYIATSHKSFSIDNYKPIDAGKNYRNGYASESNGTLVCDIEYLKRLFGDSQGNLTVLHGEIKDNGGNVIITDYIADSICYFNFDNHFNSYEDIMRGNNFINGRAAVDAIIQTDYKEKFKWLFDYISLNGKPNYKDGRMVDAIDELIKKYSVLYSVNPDFKNAYLQNARTSRQSPHFFMQYLTISNTRRSMSVDGSYGLFDYLNKDGTSPDLSSMRVPSAGSPLLREDELLLSVDAYNELYETDYTYEDFQQMCENGTLEAEMNGKEISVEAARGANANSPYLNKTFKIKGVCRRGYFILSIDSYYFLKAENVIPYALVFPDSDNAMLLIGEGEKLGMLQTGAKLTLIRKVTDIVRVFDSIFFYIGLAVCAVIIAVLALNSSSSIKQNAYEIGVIRSMGGRTGQLSAVFAVQMLITGILICIFTALGSFLGVILFNNVLCGNLAEILKTPGLGDITILSYNSAIAAIDAGIILLLTVLTVAVPILAVRRIQPINIIRSRE